jgi:hypothetical protein
VVDWTLPCLNHNRYTARQHSIQRRFITWKLIPFRYRDLWLPVKADLAETTSYRISCSSLKLMSISGLFPYHPHHNEWFIPFQSAICARIVRIWTRTSAFAWIQWKTHASWNRADEKSDLNPFFNRYRLTWLKVRKNNFWKDQLMRDYQAMTHVGFEPSHLWCSSILAARQIWF